MKKLRSLYQEHQGKVSDKWSGNLDVYEDLFAPRRYDPIRLFEIGVQNGGSLELWSKYFTSAELILGCDIDPACAELSFHDPRIKVMSGDACAPATVREVDACGGAFDVVIDDGSHHVTDVVRAFGKYFPRVRPGGIYVVEDLHSSYWKEYGGGLDAPYSSINFFKLMVDVLNRDHWGVERAASEWLAGYARRFGISLDETFLGQIGSVCFHDSLCIIEKRNSQSDGLGERVVAGDEEAVSVGHLRLSGGRSVAPSQAENPWAKLCRPAVEYVDTLTRALARQRRRVVSQRRDIQGLQDELVARMNVIEQLQGELQEVRSSRSWMLTAPYRRAGEWVRTGRQIVRNRGGLSRTFWATARVILREGPGGIRRRWRDARTSGVGGAASVDGRVVDPSDYGLWVKLYDTLDDDGRAVIRSRIASMKAQPTFSVLMPVYNPNLAWLHEAIDSVRSQLYPRWELCIADDASTDPRVRQALQVYAAENPGIRLSFRDTNGHISAATNTALSLAQGEWVVLLDQDDLISEDALYHLVECIETHPDVRMIYSDEDKLDENGNRFGPYFKSDWNPYLFLSQNMFSHLGAYHRSLVKMQGGFREGFEGAQDYDLALRCSSAVRPDQIAHIPHVLYHWRVHAQSTASGVQVKPYAIEAGEKALSDHVGSRVPGSLVKTLPCGYQVRFPLPQARPWVTLVIPTRNRVDLLRRCVESILARTDYPNYRIVVIDNGSDDPATLDYLSEVESSRVSIVRDGAPFNFSAMNNRAIENLITPIVGLVNNDIEVKSSNWLADMVSYALRPDVGAVGARLLYPSGTVQHAGVVIGAGGIANNAHQGLSEAGFGYMGRAALAGEYSAVTAACLLIRREIYHEVGGLNESRLAVAFNDVDLCLRLSELGYRNVLVPSAELYHDESASRPRDDHGADAERFAGEVNFMRHRWRAWIETDPMYNPNLTLDGPVFGLAWPPRKPRVPRCDRVQ
ncbi:glycosyltransferase [Thioalkalivibrio sp. AKL10]|uniref:glycosyltransferase family 2 protein n=1 Tax=Thioalkalivibrio sp. AKL10 TaxID=1158158 RepID=UPI000365E0A7|nr:glycosyltransferase [Thioalkalivibrio sp. AKL10]